MTSEELASALEHYAECMTARGRDDLRLAASRLLQLERVLNVAEQFDDCECNCCARGAQVSGCIRYRALHKAIGEATNERKG